MSTTTPARPRRRLLRRIGSALTVLSLPLFGFAAGLILTTPASAAANNNILIDMGSGFAQTTSDPLLNVSRLAPGGTVTGTMQLQDVSGHTGSSGVTDTIHLMLINPVFETDCTSTGKSAAECEAASRALADAIEFTFTVTGAGTPGAAGPFGYANLQGAGIPLASGLVHNDIIEVTAAASLDFGNVGNEVADGGFGFNLALGLTSTEPPNTGGPGTDPGADPNDPTDPNDPGGTTPDGADPDDIDPGPEVEGTSEALPGTGSNNVNAGNGGSAAGSPDSDNITVLGQQDSLASTGVPVILLVSIGGATLLVGAALLIATRRRTAGTS